MITYNDIYEAARKERYSEKLQPLPKNFVREVSNYLEEKQKTALKETDSFSDVVMKAKKQIENARTSFKEIIRRRRKKILDLILIASETGISKQDFDNMFDFEKKLFEEIMKSIESSDKDIDNIFNKEPVKEQKNELVLFKEDVEEFMDFDGNKTGPFEKGQMANLSKEVAKILVDDGKAKRVEES